MELPESWKRMKDDFVSQTEAWGRGISEEMGFLSSRLKEFWADPEKLISQPASEGNDLGTLAGIAPYLLVKGAKEASGTIERLFEGAKRGEIDPADALGATMLGLGAGYPGGATGAAELGVLRKVALGKLAREAKAFKAITKGATDQERAVLGRTLINNTLKEVIPAGRKIPQEWWDALPEPKWKFFKDPDTGGEFDIDKTLTAAFHPYQATERTMFHEVVAHGGQAAPPEAVAKALVPYKGELVPATEVLDMMKRVSNKWREDPDYKKLYYGTDPIEMHARVVAMDMAKGIPAEEAFLNRLPKVIQSFEASHPEVARHYRTPVLERAAEKAELSESYAKELVKIAEQHKSREEFEIDLLRRVSREEDIELWPEHYEYLVNKHPKVADELGLEDLGIDWIANPAFGDKTDVEDLRFFTSDKTQKKAKELFGKVWNERAASKAEERLQKFRDEWDAGAVTLTEDMVKRKLEPPAERVIGELKYTGKDFEPTPDKVTDLLLSKMTGLGDPSLKWLEPSAGKGQMADRLKAVGVKGDILTIEPAGVRRGILKKKGYNVVERNFFDFNKPVDRIVMNPPFSGGQAKHHVMHAWKVLKPGGELSTLVPWYDIANAKLSNPTKVSSGAKEFVKWLKDVNADLTPVKLPTREGRVSAVIVHARKER